MSSENVNKDFVGSLEKGLKVICAFDREHQQLTLADVARLTDTTRATARRFLKTLEVLEYVVSDGKYFRLSPKILELGFAYLTSQPIVDIVQPFIERVSELTGESSSVSVLEGKDIVYIARQSVNHIMSINLHIGSRLPVWYTSMGRVLMAQLSANERAAFLEGVTLEPRTVKSITDIDSLLSELDRIKQQGYCVIDEELENGLISIAVPIFNKKGVAVAAINVGASSVRMSSPQRQQEVISILRQASNDIRLLLQ